MGIALSASELIELATEQDTLDWGATLAGEITKGIVYLYGELGAGKTTLVRGWLRQLGMTGFVKSPTYTLAETYETKEADVLHLDLYRIKDPHELEFIGITDLLADADLVFFEWPEKGRDYLPTADAIIRLDFSNTGRTGLFTQNAK